MSRLPPPPQYGFVWVGHMPGGTARPVSQIQPRGTAVAGRPRHPDEGSLPCAGPQVTQAPTPSMLVAARELYASPTPGDRGQTRRSRRHARLGAVARPRDCPTRRPGGQALPQIEA